MISFNNGVPVGSSGDGIFLTMNLVGTPITILVVVNGGTPPVQYSINNGAVWFLLPGASQIALNAADGSLGRHLTDNIVLVMRRVPSGTDVTGCGAYALP